MNQAVKISTAPVGVDPARRAELDDVDANVDAVRRALAKLAEVCGDATTTDDVADLLRAERVCGTRGSRTRCPVARYVHRLTDVTVVVVSKFVVFFDARLGPVMLNMPAALTQFVRLFDGGRYPELRAPVEPATPVTA